MATFFHRRKPRQRRVETAVWRIRREDQGIGRIPAAGRRDHGPLKISEAALQPVLSYRCVAEDKGEKFLVMGNGLQASDTRTC